MVIIDTVVNTLFGGLTLDPAGMHCPAGDDAFVSSYNCVSVIVIRNTNDKLRLVNVVVRQLKALG